MKWLLTGGAGYIGSHVAHALRATGREVVVLDDLSTGVARRVPAGVDMVRASVLDRDAVHRTLLDQDIDGVIHLAGKKSVSESIAEPEMYYRENVLGLQYLIAAMRDADVGRLVFSSSAAVYGGVHGQAVDETAPTAPLSPYGWTKLVGEDLIRFAGTLTELQWISLRYFNVAGSASPLLADTSVSNLVPMIFDALDHGRAPQIFGDDYATRDGSCVRDYVHVADLAGAHVAAAARLEVGAAASVYNVGTGTGVSVKEVLAAVRDVTGRDFDPLVTPRRPGDPASVVASAAAIRDALHWRSEHDLRSIISSAWAGWLARRAT